MPIELPEDGDITPEQHSANTISTLVPFEKSGSRLDQIAAELFPDYSRSRLQQWIREGQLTVNGSVAKPNQKLGGGETLKLCALEEPQGEWQAEQMAIDIVHEDAHILVLNKPAGLVVHPAAGNYSGTLLNGLLHYCPALSHVPRAGIVHRLDKDTTGLMVVAKTISAQANLVAQLQARTVKREYEAIVQGGIRQSGKVDAPIGRHPGVRTRMAVVPSGKPAVTHFSIMRRYNGFSHIRLQLETGRTHQIRVHMAHLGFPLVGDPVYGKRLPQKRLRVSPELQPLADFPRQALHAIQLGLVHPGSQKAMQWQLDRAEDMQALLALLEQVAGYD